MIFRRPRKLSEEEEQAFRDRMQDEKLTAKDFFAMSLSAFLMIVVPCIVILCGLGALMLWLFGAF